MVYDRDDIEGLDSSIITHRQVLKHSGHVDTFTDPLVDCKSCKTRHRADHLQSNKCPNCGSDQLTEPRDFNLMFQTNVGPVSSDENIAYLRPETAQGIFSNFKNIVDSTSRSLPFGIAQIGKAFRNEITPRNFIFRVREFEQMELEFFVKPDEDEKWHQYWIDQRYNWWLDQGLSKDDLVKQDQTGDELAHYAKATVDLLYRFPHGLEELEGVANRTDYDLGSHTKNQNDLDIQAQVKENTDSTTRLAIQDIQTKKWTVPYVIEPSAGLDRGVLAVLNAAFHEEMVNDNKRLVLKLPYHLAPIKVAILPLAKNKPEMIKKATEIHQIVKKARIGRTIIENKGNIGKMYRRHDEIGTPYCITIDFETLEGDIEKNIEKNTVTIRNRDTLEQIRVKVTDLVDFFKKSN